LIFFIYKKIFKIISRYIILTSNDQNLIIFGLLDLSYQVELYINYIY